MKNREEIAKVLMDPHYQLQSIVFVQKHQFEAWLTKLFLANEELHKTSNLFYNEIFTIVLYQFLTEGRDYIETTVLPRINKVGKYMQRWHYRLYEGLKEIRSQYTDIEFAFLEYHRHNACHIFQTGYDVIRKDGTVKTKEQQLKKIKKTVLTQPLINLELAFFNILEQYGSDGDFDSHFSKKLYPIIKQLYTDLNQINKEEIQAQNKGNDIIQP